MKKRVYCLIWLMTTAVVGSAPEKTNLAFYVQLVRGTKDSSPPTKESKAIGPKLSAEFQPVFKYKYFWQVQYEEVRVAPGATTKVRLSPEREVEIDLTKAGKRIVTAVSDGKVVARNVDFLDAPMTLIGGDRNARSVWFIAVRRDKPSID